MSEPRDFNAAPSDIPAELVRLDRKVAELRGVVRLMLLGLIITTGGLFLFMYRQTKLLRYQIIAQSEMVARAEASVAPELQLVPRFQQVGWAHPDYASNVLAQFGLPALPPTNAAAPGQP